MKTILSRRSVSFVGLALFLAAGISASAQSGVVPQATPETTPQVNAGPPQDPILQLNLTPEQRQQIRAIRIESRDERAAINQRLKETKFALDKALEANPPDEALIEQRVREASEARAASLRLQSLTAARMRRVLTPEQLIKLKELQLQVQQNRRERQQDRASERGRNLPNPRNGILPAGRRNPLRRQRP